MNANELYNIKKKRGECGWNDINFFIIMDGSLYTKKTKNNCFDDNFKFDGSKRTTCFYSNNEKLYTWTKRDNTRINSNTYIYGNPYPKYDF
jgi:hypothetical protein